MQTTHMIIGEYPVSVSYGPFCGVEGNEAGRFWRSDKVSIFNPYFNQTNISIEDEQIAAIMEYLYNEGFILDRRTPYEVIEEK